uniref:LRAT domain-containing protein n=1 Tax=Cyprinus carpio TaxID=7962 RepID=A0A8C2BUU9_CYPCA
MLVEELNREPKPGDLIEIFRGGYQHWAIYVGDGNVIHLGTASENTDAGACSVKSVLQDSAKVMKEKLQKVVGNDKFQIRNLLDDKCTPRPIEDILQDAESLVGKVLPYDVATHKCDNINNLFILTGARGSDGWYCYSWCSCCWSACLWNPCCSLFRRRK